MRTRTRKITLFALIFALIAVTAIGALATNDSKGDVDMMDAINADTTLQGYKVGESFTIANDGYIGIPVEVTAFFDPARVAHPGYAVEDTILVVYVVNASFDRIGTESDTDIIKSMVERGYIVAVADYKNDPRAVSPDLDFSLQKVRVALQSGSAYGNSLLIPSGTYHNSFVIPSGYDVSPFNVYWEIDKHSTDGTLEKIVEIWNNDFRGCKADYIIKWTDDAGNRKATQNGHDGTSPVWLDENGFEDENGEYIRVKHTLATVITDCVKPDGSPIDLNLYMHIMYPTGGVDVPVLALVGSAEHLSGGSANVERPQLVGAVMNGYAGVAYDHGYTPMARNDHYGYFDGNAQAGHVTGDNLTYSIQFYNSIEINTAAMRFLRYFSLTGMANTSFDLDGIGVFGNSKGGWMQFLGELDPYASSTRRIYPDHHGETRYEAGKTVTEGVIDGGEPQPWMTFKGEEISPRANLVYCSCGGTSDAITKGHAPVFITANINDGSYYNHSNDFVNICRRSDIPAMWFEIPLGHTLGYGKDVTYGVDVYEAFFDFADYWLKGEAVEVEYISADMTYGGMPTYAPFTVKFTGTVRESELSAVTLKASDGNHVEGFWTSAFGGTEWSFHPNYLKSDTEYTLTVPAGVKGDNGLASEKEYTYTVTTGYESVISENGVTRVTGTQGEYYTFTVPAASGVTDFNVNKYLLRIRVDNDAVNDLGIYPVSGFNASDPDASTVGARIAKLNVNGRGYYELDLTSLLSASIGQTVTYLIKAESAAGETLLFNGTNDTGYSRGLSVASNVGREWTELDGNGVIAIKEFGLNTTYKNDVFYGNLSMGAVIANQSAIGGTALTDDDVGRRFRFSFRVYDTVERTVSVSLNDCTSEANGIFDPYGYNYNLRTKAGEWVTFTFEYDVYEPAEYGTVGMAKKVLYIATHGFGNVTHPIYFDDITTTEIVTDVTIGECALVLSTTEQRVDPLETPYGYIPETYADPELYPFVVFDSKGKFIIATDVWATDAGGGALGACAKQSTVNNVILLRRDYHYADATSYNNFAFVYGNVTIDLDGHDIYLDHTHGKGMFYCHAKRSTATQINIKNGGIVINKGELIVLGAWNTGNYDHANTIKQFGFDFKNVDFSFAEGATMGALLSNTSADAPVIGSLSFEGCSFDFENNVPTGRSFLTLGDPSGFIKTRAVIKGGVLKGGDLQSLELYTVGNNSAYFALEKDENGDFPQQKISDTGMPLNYSVTVDGVPYSYLPVGEEDGYTVYSLLENPLNTPYGDVTEEFESSTDYPFALFMMTEFGYEFVTGLSNPFSEEGSAQITRINADVLLYMRRDFTVDGGTLSLVGIKRGLKLDLGGYTLTAPATDPAFTVGGIKSGYSLTLMDGTVLFGSASSLIHVEDSVGSANTSCLITLDGVELVGGKAVCDSPIISHGSVAGGLDLEVKINECTLDLLSSNWKLTVFGAGSTDGSVKSNVTVIGGVILLADASYTTLTSSANADSAVRLDEGVDGYTVIAVLAGGGAPKFSVETVKEGAVAYELLDSTDGFDNYVLSNLSTPYGQIDPSFSSMSAFPVAVFKKTDSGYEFVTAMANMFLDESVTNYMNIDADIVIYLRRDYTAVSRFTNLRMVKRGITFDLGGHTLTANASSQTLYVINNPPRHKVERLYICIKNGSVITDKARTFMLFGSNNTGASVNYDVFFEGVSFFTPDGNTNAYPIIEHTNATSPFEVNVTFNDCTFDMRNASNVLRPFNIGNRDGTIVTYVTVNGGEILLSSTAKFTLEYRYNDSGEGWVRFGKGTNGYICIVLPAGTAAPGYVIKTAEGGSASFGLVSSDTASDVYTLTPTVTTPYGEIPPTYANAEIYPFVVFKADGSFFGAYPTLFGDTSGDLSVIAMHGARSAGNGAVILMRANWTYTDKISYPNIGNNTGTVTIDLGGFTIYDNHSYSGGLFNLMAKPSTPNGTNTLVVKNGSILVGNKNPLVSFGAFNADVTGVTLNITFEDMTLGYADDAGATLITSDANPVCELYYNVKLKDCVIDMTNAPDGAKLISTGGKAGAVTVSAEGISAVGTPLQSVDGITVKNSVTLYTDFNYNVYIPLISGLSSVTFGGESIPVSDLPVRFIDGVAFYHLEKRVQPFGAYDSTELSLALTLADGSLTNAECKVGVMSYLETLMGDENEVNRALAADMLAYIRAAYNYFAPTSLEAQKVNEKVNALLGENYDAENMPDTSASAVMSTNGLSSAALMLDSTPALVFYPSLDASGNLIYAADSYVFEVNGRLADTELGTDAEGRLYIAVRVYAYEMISTVSYTVLGADASGEYNLMAYYGFAKDTDPALKLLVERLMKYSESAKAYKEANQ